MPDDGDRFAAARLATLALGTPSGWEAFLDRLSELLATDTAETWCALQHALGETDPAWETRIELRRRAVQQATLERLVTPTDTVITGLAALLVELVKLTPGGLRTIGTTDTASALRYLAAGHVPGPYGGTDSGDASAVSVPPR